MYGLPDDINPDECPYVSCDGQDYQGGPVNTKTGNYLYQAQDVQLQTLAGRLAFKRTYSAQATDAEWPGLLGYGWTHNHDRRLIFPGDPQGEDGVVILRGQSGSALRFTITDDDQYVARPEVKAQMVEIDGGEAGITYVITAPNQSVLTFNDSLLKTERDPQGNVLTYTYAVTGWLARVEDASGRYLAFEVGMPGLSEDRLLSVSDHTGRVVQFGYYTETGDLAVVTDTRGLGWTYTYSGSTHWLYEARDPYGRLIERNEYDAYGRVLTQTDGLSHTISFDYHIDTTSRTTVTQPLGQVLVDVYDSRNTLVSQVRPGANVAAGRGYDGHFNRRSSADPNGHTSAYSWSENGYNLETVTDAQGHTTHFGYDACNHLTQTVDAHGGTTTYAYDVYTVVITGTGGEGEIITHTYTLCGLNQPLTITDALGNVTVNRYDAQGRLIQTARNGQYTTTYAYDAYGQRTAVTDTLDGVTRYGYDELGRTVGVTTPQGITRYAYDAADHVIAITRNYTTTVPNPDPLLYNLVTRYGFDKVGRQTHVTETAPLPGGGVEERVTRTWYDSIGQVVSVTQNYRPGEPQNYLNQYNLTTWYGYDAAGNQTAVTDTLGHVNRTFYDLLNRPVTMVVNYVDEGPMTNDQNVRTMYGYDPAGNLVTTTDALGRMVVNGYDELNRLATTTVNYVDEGPTTKDQNLRTVYGYDAVGNVVTVTDPMGRVTLNEYDALNRLVRTTVNYSPTHGQNYQNQYNLVTEYGYDPQSGQRVAVTDTLGNVTRYEYDALGRLVTTTDALSGATWVEYNAVGQRWKSHACAELAPDGSCALQYTTVFTYDIAGRLAETRDPAGGVTRYAYDALGNTRVVTDPAPLRFGDYSAEGHATHYAYDALNRLVTTTNALSGVTVLEYDALGRRVSNRQSSAVGGPWQVTSYGYDGLGRTAAMTDALGNVTRYAYDSLGNRIAITDPLTHTTVYTYDSLNRLAATQNAEGDVTRYEYDALGNRTVMTDAESIVTRYEYDAAGRLAAVVENVDEGPTTKDQNVRTEYGYDPLGRRTVITNALGYTSVYTYDALGRLVGESDALTHTTVYTYNLLGQRVAVQDADGTVVSYSYDAGGRLTAIQYPTSSVTYAYDRVGNRVAMTDSVGSTRYQYDALYRLVRVQDPFSQVVSYTYDLVGNRIGLNYPDGKTVTYTYDLLNRLIQVEDWDGGLTRYGYDAAGRLISATLPNGVQSAYTYDDADRLTQIEHRNDAEVLLARYAYALDKVGNRMTVTETILMPIEGLAALPTCPGGRCQGGGMSAAQVVEAVVGRGPGLASMAGEQGSESANQRVSASANERVGESANRRAALLPNPTPLRPKGGDYSLQSPISNLALRADRPSLPADGASLAYLAVFAYADDGEPLPDGAPVSWETSLGELVEDDEGRTTKDGLAWVALQAGETPGVAVVTATVGVSAQQRISVEIAAPEAAVYRLDEETGGRDGSETALELARNTVRETGGREAVFVQGPYHRLDFTAQGLTFSGAAPGGRSIALGYHLQEVRLGATTWLTRTDVSPQVEENAARYGLGQGVTEEYVALDAGVEQRLVLAEPLPAEGQDVTIVGAFEAPLTARLNVSRTVVYWYHPRGGRQWLAQYGPALAYDAAGHLAVLEMRLSGTEVEIVLPGAWLARATYPVVVDPLLGSRLTLASGIAANRYTPDVAYNPDDDQYLATWLFATETTVGVHARRVWADGAPDGGIFTLYQVSGAPVSEWEAPRAAYDPTSDKYLAAWAVNSGLIEWALRSRQVPASGSALGSLQAVDVGAAHYNPAVAADSLNGGYLATWDAAQNVYARRVGADGAPTGSVINVAASAAVEQDPDVAFGSAAGEYLVVWEQDSDAYARRVTSGGGLPGNAFAVATAAGNQVDPALAYAAPSDTFLATWSADNDVHGQRVDSQGRMVGNVMDIATGQPTQIAPDLGYNALTEDWLAVWRHTGTIGFANEPWGRVAHESGQLSGNEQRLWNYATGSRVATSGAGGPTGNHLVVWDNSANTVIYGQRFRPLQAGFTAEPRYGPAPLTVQFTDAATPVGQFGPVADQWYWTFGEGGAELPSTQRNPLHTYQNPGIYAVSQRVTDTQTGEWDVLTRHDYITVVRVITYRYDGLYRLVQADYSNGESFQYAYDAVGNRTAYTATIASTAVTTYSYDAANRLVNAGGVTYTWDARGNLLADGVYTYTWDAAGRLITVTDGVNTLRFRYDGDGNRLLRIVNGTLTTHTLDVGLPLPEVLIEHPPKGRTHPQSTLYLHLPHSIAADNGKAWTYTAADGLGSVRQQLDASGQVVSVNGYRPFGEPLDGDGGTPYGFTGEWWEVEAGLLFLRTRYLRVDLGRFISQDPLSGDSSQPQSLNGYSWVEDNPINRVDPSGLLSNRSIAASFGSFDFEEVMRRFQDNGHWGFLAALQDATIGNRITLGLNGEGDSRANFRIQCQNGLIILVPESTQGRYAGLVPMTLAAFEGAVLDDGTGARNFAKRQGTPVWRLPNRWNWFFVNDRGGRSGLGYPDFSLTTNLPDFKSVGLSPILPRALRSGLVGGILKKLGAGVGIDGIVDRYGNIYIVGNVGIGFGFDFGGYLEGYVTTAGLSREGTDIPTEEELKNTIKGLSLGFSGGLGVGGGAYAVDRGRGAIIYSQRLQARVSGGFAGTLWLFKDANLAWDWIDNVQGYSREDIHHDPLSDVDMCNDCSNYPFP